MPPEEYDETYYRKECMGSVQWDATGGRMVDPLYPGFLARAQLRPGETVVDLGTGRGELLVTAVEMGAAHAYGVEYSETAVRMSERTLDVHDPRGKAEVMLADARSVPLPDAIAELVCLVDVVEHLAPPELHIALLEARRLLKPGGRLVIHTMPNRLIFTVTYRALRLLAGGNRWAANPRTEPEQKMHVNELTVRELRRALERAGFEAHVELGQWIRTDFVQSRWAQRVYTLLSKLGPLAHLGVADMWAFARPSA